MPDTCERAGQDGSEAPGTSKKEGNDEKHSDDAQFRLEYEEIKARTMHKMIEDISDKQRLLFLTNHQALKHPQFLSLQNMAAIACEWVRPACLDATCMWLSILHVTLVCSWFPVALTFSYARARVFCSLTANSPGGNPITT